MRRLAALGSSLVGLVLLAGSILPPQITTRSQPTSVSFPVSPHPDACTVEPRAEVDLLALVETAPDEPSEQELLPEPTVVPVPVGSPAEQGLYDEIAVTVYEQYACFNTGDALRGYAFVTDGHLGSLAAEGLVTDADIDFLLEGPAPVPLEAQTRILAVTDVSVLADGRVGAFVVTSQDVSVPDTGYTLFARVDDRWRVDAVIPFL